MAAPSLEVEPPLPRGERIELPGRGTTFVRCVDGPPGGPTVVLLHGWMASGGLNWFTTFGPLSQRCTVVAPDLRGHGRGVRSRRRFRLADCADDVAALLRHLDTGPVILVGYSMGGPVAQLLWRRHPELVQGMVLCATAYRFVAGARERFVFSSMMATAIGTTRAGQLMSQLPAATYRRWGPAATPVAPSTLRAWAAGEMRRHDKVKLMEAGQAIGSYNARRWIGEVDVPTTVLVTGRDRAIAPAEQRRLAAAIPGAQVQVIDDGHVACAKREFGPAVVRAVDSVVARLAGGVAAAGR
ncbi:MAG: alpha/beta fold hydrolase [Acidimicrobiales bacterium]